MSADMKLNDSKKKTIARDISWLSFNARVLQEAADDSVPLRERIKFLGIFSNNMDEFFRVRVATLKRMIELRGKRRINMHLESAPEKILEDIQNMVLLQQNQFARTWEKIVREMEENQIFLVTEQDLNREQKVFVTRYFEEEVRVNTVPIMIESVPAIPYLRDKSIYLGVLMSRTNPRGAYEQKFAIVEVPSKATGKRFINLPSAPGRQDIILLEDIIRFNLPSLFSYFGYERFESWIFKVTKDAEIDIDSDVNTTIIQKLEKGLKNRRKGKPVRFVYDKEMNPSLLEFLMKRLHLSRRDNLIPGGRIHNFRHFMDFPDIFPKKNLRKKPFHHPLLPKNARVTDVIRKKDVMLNFPYHSFSPIIDLLREAAIDPDVTTIKITAYRLASNSKVINALINAVRNGKQVTVMLELRARFDEEANLEWKSILEEEGVKVVIGVPNMKVHAKLCLIRKKINKTTYSYGFVSTGNLNEKTSTVYGDHCLLTANRSLMADINRVFTFLEHPQPDMLPLKACKKLILCPIGLRRELIKLIQQEIKLAKAGKPANILLKMNSLSDEVLIDKLYEAARAGVAIQLIIRGICCMQTENKKFPIPIKAISIVDEYLEHARVFVFHQGGKERMFISSADWMVRNLDHRIEATVEVIDDDIKKVLKNILNIQLDDNIKARKLDNALRNDYVEREKADEPVRAQLDIYNYLLSKRQHQTTPESK
jgi:polyphosphate kinase